MFIRYPGSKAKLHRRIRDSLPFSLTDPLWLRAPSCYCEPFFGSGAIAWELLPTWANKNTTVIVNDLDPGIASMWKAVRDAPCEFNSLVSNFIPSPDLFYKFKEEDGDLRFDPVVTGFRKLALHQMSFSGLGFMSGGPLGGREQKSEYNTSCRWNKNRIGSKVLECHNLMRAFRRFEIYCEDFSATLKRLPSGAFAYLDPPYYLQGKNLYKHAMEDTDHERLALQLRAAPFRWVVSYDDHERIRKLYSWTHIKTFVMTPTVQTSKEKRRKNSEVVICSHEWN